MLFVKNKVQDLRTNLISKLQERAGIDNIDNLSVAGQFVSVMAESQGNQLKEFEALLNQTNWKTATGEKLISLAALVGVYPSKPKAAEVFAYEKNLEFYTDFTFGMINNATDILIPKGTIVYIDANDSNVGRSTQYQIIEDTNLSAANSSAFVSARCLAVGTSGNVAANTLKKHDFTNYQDSANKTLKVRNNYAIINGIDTETDEQIRSLISTAWVANGSQNQSTLEHILTSFPGVKEYTIIPFYSGLGTTGIIVDPLSRHVSSNWWRQLENQIKTFASTSEIFVVQKPTYLILEVSIEITFSSSLSQAAKVLLANNIKDYIRINFHGLSIGQSISLSNLITNIYNLNSNIVQITNDKFYDISLTTIDPLENESSAAFEDDLVIAAPDQKILLNPLINLVII